MLTRRNSIQKRMFQPVRQLSRSSISRYTRTMLLVEKLGLSDECMIDLIIIGFLSAYALLPTVGTLELRQEWGQLPQDVSGYEVFLSVADCGLIGKEATLAVDGDLYDALIFDCAGVDDGGLAWMTENAIAAEVDYWFWLEHPEYVGSELEVSIFYEH